MIRSGVEWKHVLVYLDDLIIFSADAESDLLCLDTVLTLLGEHQGLSESGFFSRIWDISRYIWIHPLESSRHPM